MDEQQSEEPEEEQFKTSSDIDDAYEDLEREIEKRQQALKEAQDHLDSKKIDQIRKSIEFQAFKEPVIENKWLPGDYRNKLVELGFAPNEESVQKHGPDKIEDWPTPDSQAGLASKLAWVKASDSRDASERLVAGMASKGEQASPDIPSSPMEDLITGVMDGIHNLDVYVNVDTQPTTFIAEFIAVLRLPDGAVVANHRTAKISKGASNMQVNREIQIVKDSMVLEIAQRAFVYDLILVEHALFPKMAKQDYEQ